MNERIAVRSQHVDTGARRKNIALWALQIVTAVAILGAGAGAFAGATQAVRIFDAIGLGDWLRYLTGILQLAGAVALLIPRLNGPAALALAGMWLVAVATHLFVIGGSPALAGVYLLLTTAIAWGRRDRTADLVARITGAARETR